MTQNTSTAQNERTWTATITVHANACDLAFSRGETVPATVSPYNLQADQRKAAIAEAAAYLRAGLGEFATVQLLKTTKSHGTVRDQSWTVEFDKRNKIIAQR